MSDNGWRDISTFDPLLHLEGRGYFIIAGEYLNGFRWVDTAYWDARGWFVGHRLEKPLWWQPMPEPPTGEP